MNNTDTVDFQVAYKEALLWANTYVYVNDEILPISETDWDGQLSIWDFTDEAADAAHDDCEAFLNMDWKGHSVLDLIESLTIAYGFEQAGHDFALTRNGHGTGFWDRGLGETGELLSEAARTFGSSDLYVTDEGKVETE